MIAYIPLPLPTPPSSSLTTTITVNDYAPCWNGLDSMYDMLHSDDNVRVSHFKR